MSDEEERWEMPGRPRCGDLIPLYIPFRWPMALPPWGKHPDVAHRQPNYLFLEAVI